MYVYKCMYVSYLFYVPFCASSRAEKESIEEAGVSLNSFHAAIKKYQHLPQVQELYAMLQVQLLCVCSEKIVVIFICIYFAAIFC